MKTFKVNGSNGSYIVNLPTKIEEITPEYLADCVAHISPAPEYSIIAVVYKEALNVILNTFKKRNTETNISIIPKFIKSGVTESDFIKSIPTGKTVIVNGSDVSLGHHISSPVNKITINNVVALCEGDKNIWNNSIGLTEKCYFVEFKLIPNNAIHGTVGDNKDIDAANTFIISSPTDETNA